MMPDPRIKILSEELINKIAAGEVVERPASVVKELVENSIDAAACQIKIEIQGAGQKLIRVSDNGQGMNKEEIALSVERHSTSKINKLDDLFNIQSLGFRGEALPSIASVSRLEIRSRVKGEDAGMEAGSRMLVEGGKIAKTEVIGCSPGTSITIKDLFFNTPARKKFLKSPITEMGHIGDIVSKYAMAYPSISFELISDGKPMLHSSGSGNLRDAVMSVYGVDLLKGLVKLDSNEKIKISGLTSLPTLSRIDRNAEIFYVNGRYVRNFLLNRALEEAYRTLIPNNRYPVAILFIEIDPKLVDVNVHPTKREVKFVRTQEVMDAIRSSIKDTFLNLKGYQITRGSAGEDQDISVSVGEHQNIRASDTLIPFPRADRTLIPVAEDLLEVAAVQPLLPIYQLKETYIICTDGDELVIIDQHAAHERVIFDQICKQEIANNKQSILIPENLELDPKEIAALHENLESLRELGFDLEEFGNNTYIIRSVPSVASKASPKPLLIDILSELQSLGKSARLEIKQENIRKMIACKSAIKAGDKLSPPEMNQLIRDLYTTENPHTCPHGRPTMVRIAEEDLRRRFHR